MPQPNQTIQKPLGALVYLSRIRNYYTGVTYYALAFTVFISLQFAIHDALIEYISQFTGSSQKSILSFLQIDSNFKDSVDDN